MNLRNEWKSTETENIFNRFYTKEETVSEVVENFNIRRHHSAEGEQLTINGITDWCLVQTSGNPLRELDDHRKIICPLSMPMRCGDYVKYIDKTWLIDTNVVNVSNAYQMARMNKCSCVLKWQDKFGKVIERAVVTYNASSYNNGISEGRVIELGSDQLMILIPFDEDTKCVQRGKVFFIDSYLEDPMTYRLTRPDRTTYVDNGTGYIQWLVTECRYSPTEEELKQGICNYIFPDEELDEPTDDTVDFIDKISCEISGKKNLKTGYERIYTAVLKTTDGVEVSWDDSCSWRIDSPFEVKQEISGNRIALNVEDESLIGSSFILSVIRNNTPIQKIRINIEAGF